MAEIILGRVKGEQGERGLQGLQGQQGLQGIKGDKGEKGDIGPIGIPGVNGAQGLTGLKGDTGTIGLTGAQGQVGPIGPEGLIGPIGPMGPAGGEVAINYLGSFDMFSGGFTGTFAFYPDAFMYIVDVRFTIGSIPFYFYNTLMDGISSSIILVQHKEHVGVYAYVKIDPFGEVEMITNSNATVTVYGFVYKEKV